MSKIITHLSGGLVQWVTKMGKGKIDGVIIVDTDTEDTSIDEGLTVITDSNDREATAWIHEEPIYEAKKDTDIYHFVQTYLDNNDIDKVEDNNQHAQLPLLLASIRTQEGKDRIARLLKGV